jgi:hypothetical protein
MNHLVVSSTDLESPRLLRDDLLAWGQSGNCGCGHAVAAHDEIAARFCGATAMHSLDRKCICRDELSATEMPATT